MSEEPQPAEPVELFISYSHKDDELRAQLETSLVMLRRRGVVRQWSDRRINPGQEWDKQIDEHLESADIILLLVSSDFLASDYCYDIEIARAVQRHEAGEARVIPVILRFTDDWQSAPFGKLQALPRDAQPVKDWPDRDKAFADVAAGIRQAIAELLSERKPSLETHAAATAEPAAAVNLPRPPIVGFVARRDEQGRDIITRLKEELDPAKNQLVALWGPGGVGKSTLAAEFVRATEKVFNGRIAWVSALGRSNFSLATLLDEIATRLGHEDLRKVGPEAKAAQVGALVSKAATLVVLDNFETVPEDEQARCLDFLSQNASCPGLITTRSRVNCDDVYNIPLAAMTLDEARDFLRRLVERTRKPSNFDGLDRDDLIRRCEANPLVLQWVVKQIDLAKRPQDVLDDLARGEGDAAERVFTRSFNLHQLGDDGRAALLALSLFTPDASREALAEVSGFVDNLQRLNVAVEKLSALWLIEATEGNERLFLRGLTRELAKSRLSKHELASDFRLRYIIHFLHYAKTHKELTPADLDSLEAEKDNVLDAMDTASEMHDWENVVVIRLALDKFLYRRGYWDEAVRSADQAQAAAREMKNDWYAALLASCIAIIRYERGEYDEAGRIYRESLEIFRGLEDKKDIAASLHGLGLVAQGQGDLERAYQLYNESLEIEKESSDQSGIATLISQIGIVLFLQGKIDESKRQHEESLVIRRRLGDHHGIALDLHQLAMLAGKRGDIEEARRLYGESLEINKGFNDQYGMAVAFGNLGLLAEAEGNKADATRLFREALRIFEKLGSPWAEMARKALVRVEVMHD